MDKISSLLANLGLKEPEIAVYRYLIERPLASLSEIAGGAGMFRPAVYRSLSRLVEKNIVSVVMSGKRKAYAANDPATLRNIVRNISIDLEEALPDIEDLYRARGAEPVIRVFRGTESISAIFSDIVDSLKTGDVFYRYTSEKDLDFVNRHLPRNYREKRDAKRLERLVISNRRSGSRKKPRLERFIKFMPDDTPFEENAIQLIYGDRIAFIDLNSETGFIIENKALADFQKSIFRAFYKRL